jgi:two-component system, NtrC family, sensor kinase
MAFPAFHKRILIIDPDPEIRRLYQEILGPSTDDPPTVSGHAPPDESAENFPEPYTLAFTERGEEGVEEVVSALEDGAPFAVAFVDMQLPGMDGAGAARLIWSLDPNVKVVVVTAFDELTPCEMIQVDGAQEIFYLRKPFHGEEIKQFARALTSQWSLEQEREMLAAQLEKMNEDLREKVEEQATLLIQSEKMSSIGMLAAGVAHEINNPISFIKSNLTTLLEYSRVIAELYELYQGVRNLHAAGEAKSLSALLGKISQIEEKQKMRLILKDMIDLVEESLEGTNRVRKIVSDLKTFSRIDQAEQQSINLNDALDTALNILWNEIKNKAKIVREYGDLPPVPCFPQKISQVFMNILINSVQAMKEWGTIRIATRYEPGHQNGKGDEVQVLIADTGQGIRKENLPKIFDPFFTTKPVGQGTGLGLSISYDIVKAHAGKIEVASEEGVGTTFCITLPVDGLVPTTEEHEPTEVLSVSPEPSVPREFLHLMKKNQRDKS